MSERSLGVSVTRSAEVRLGDVHRTLGEGELLTYGRASDRDLRIDDRRVSGHAGILFVEAGCVWVRHDSASHGLEITGLGTDPVLLPARRTGGERPALQALTAPRTGLELIGSDGRIRMEIDATDLPGPDPAAPPAQADPTEVIRDELDVDQRRLLAALAEPMLLHHGARGPRTTPEVAHRLGITRKRTEHALTALRERLTELGVSGLIRDPLIRSGAARGEINFVAVLGRFAYLHGWVLRSDLALLDPLDRSG